MFGIEQPILKMESFMLEIERPMFEMGYFMFKIDFSWVGRGLWRLVAISLSSKLKGWGLRGKTPGSQ